LIFGYPRRQVRTERRQPRLDSSRGVFRSSREPTLPFASEPHALDEWGRSRLAGGEAQPQPQAQPPHPRPALPHLATWMLSDSPTNARWAAARGKKRRARWLVCLIPTATSRRPAGGRHVSQMFPATRSISTHGLSSKPNDATARYLSSSILIFNYYSRAPPPTPPVLPACRRSVRHASRLPAPALI
jgi:hypothetical protein